VPTPRTTCRDHLLDAAERVVVKTGIGSLTLDAVAKRAKVSKGGLLYHFPNKDALIEALVLRICNGWRADYTEAIGSVPEGPGRGSRGLMNMCISTPEKWTETLRQSSVVLVAVLANNPKLIKPLREVYGGLFKLIDVDRQSAAIGEIVVLALNGLWFEFIFGLKEVSPARLAAIRKTLNGFVETDLGRIGGRIGGRVGGVGKGSGGAKKSAGAGRALRAGRGAKKKVGRGSLSAITRKGEKKS